MDLRELPNGAFHRHPWEIARARFFGNVLASQKLLGNASLLDVGAGDGYVARTLVERAPGIDVVCLDVHYTAAQLETLRQKPPPNVIFTCSPPERRFDVILLLDVLEHVPNDVTFLRGLVQQRLRPGGAVLVSVPAYQELFTAHDVALGHYRRYRPDQIRQVTEEVGLTCVAHGNLFHSLLAPRALSKLGELGRGIRSAPTTEPPAEAETDAGKWRAGAIVTKAVDAALWVDNSISSALSTLNIGLPGLSTWALARAS